jgi:hypothetical protein
VFVEREVVCLFVCMFELKLDEKRKKKREMASFYRQMTPLAREWGLDGGLLQ